MRYIFTFLSFFPFAFPFSATAGAACCVLKGGAPDTRRARAGTIGWLLVLAICFGSGGCVTAPPPSKKGEHMVVRTTAYTHTEPGGESSAVGTRLRFGSDVISAASDWSWLPVGTRFKLLPTGRTYVIEDYGSALVGKKTIDLYMPHPAMMHAWGVRSVEIEILEWGSFEVSRMLLARRSHNASVRAMLASMPEVTAASRAN